jgi:hypothetical protein
MPAISINTYHQVSEFHLPEPSLTDYEQLQGQEKAAAALLDALCQLDQAMVSLCHQQVDNMRMAQRVLADDLKSHDDTLKRKAAATVMRTCNLKSTHSVVSTLKADYRTLYETFKTTRLNIETARPEVLHPIKPPTYTHPTDLPPHTPLPYDKLPYQLRLDAYEGRVTLPQTVGDMLANWQTTYYPYYRKAYAVWSPITLPKRLKRTAPKGKRLLYCTPPTPSHRYVFKNTVPLNASQAPPKGSGDDAPLVKHTPVGAVHASPVAQKPLAGVNNHATTPPTTTPYPTPTTRNTPLIPLTPPPPAELPANPNPFPGQPWDEDDTPLTLEQLEAQLAYIQAYTSPQQHPRIFSTTKQERAG